MAKVLTVGAAVRSHLVWFVRCDRAASGWVGFPTTRAKADALLARHAAGCPGSHSVVDAATLR